MAVVPEQVVQEQIVPEKIEGAPPVQDEVKPEPQPPLVVEEPVKAPEPAPVIVKKGTHPDELQSGNYVIVGAFKSRSNAERYSHMLRSRGRENSFGFVSEKKTYYVHVFSSDDLDQTRKIRNQYRSLSDFQFADSWVLTVEE